MATPRTTPSRAFKTQRYAGGAITLGTTTTSFAAVPTLSQFVLAAQVGDVLQYDLSLCWGGAAATEVALDAATWSAVPAIVNHFGVGGATGWGTSAWSAPPTATYARSGGSSFYTVQAADISAAGLVTVGLVYRPNTAAARDIYSTTTVPLHHACKNLGPPDPY